MSRTTPIAFRIIDAFFRHVWLFLLALVVVSGITMTVLYKRSLTFHASALTQVNPGVASELGVAEGNSWETPAQQKVDSLNDLLMDNQPKGFMDNALARAQLGQPISLDPTAQDPRLAKLYKGLSIGTQSNTTYAIGLIWDDKEEAKRIVEAFRAQYIEELGAERSAKSVETIAFLDQQIASYGKKVRKTEQILIDYKSRNAGELPEAQSADITQLSSLQAQMDNMRISQYDAQAKRQALKTRIAQVPPRSVTEQTTSESPLQAQIKELQAKRDVMLADNMFPDHPLVVALSGQISDLQKQEQEKARNGAPEAKGAVQTKTVMDPEYQTLQSQLMEASIAQEMQQRQMKLLQNQIAQYSSRVQQIPAAQRELTDKTRDYSLNKAHLDALYQQRLQEQDKGSLDRIEASSALQPIGLVFAEPTTGKTKQAIMLAGSLLLGLIVGIIAVVLSEWSDRSLRYAADTQRLLGVPVLGAVPEARALAAPRMAVPNKSRTLPAPGGGL